MLETVLSHLKVARIMGMKENDESTLSKDLLVHWIQMIEDTALVHLAAHHVSPKSSFLNAPRLPQGLILYLIDPIMT